MDTFQGINSDPVTLHKYLYGESDPVSKFDPSGYMTLSSLNIGMTDLALLTTVAIGTDAFSMMGRSHVNTWNDRLTPDNVTSSLTGMIILASMVASNSPLLKMIRTKSESKDKSRRYIAREAEIIGGKIVVGRQLIMGEAIIEVNAEADVLAKSKGLAYEIALLAGGGKQPIGPEIHLPSPFDQNKWPAPRPKSYKWHYHRNLGGIDERWKPRRGKAHVFY